jgi:hypothetical protein
MTMKEDQLKRLDKDHYLVKVNREAFVTRLVYDAYG